MIIYVQVKAYRFRKALGLITCQGGLYSDLYREYGDPQKMKSRMKPMSSYPLSRTALTTTKRQLGRMHGRLLSMYHLNKTEGGQREDIQESSWKLL